MSHSLKVIILSLFLLLGPFQEFSAPAMRLQMGSSHYAAQLENYYRKPKPEIILPMLRTFVQEGRLNKSENRLMLGAFLSELLKKRQVDLKKMLEVNEKSRQLRHTLAWSAHLAGNDYETACAELLSDPRDKALAAQIKTTPDNLLAWDIASEPAVMLMFWAAFMANGDFRYLDRIICLAREFAHVDESWQNGERMLLAETAAASLYDETKTNELVRKRLKFHLQTAQGKEKALLEKLLGGAG